MNLNKLSNSTNNNHHRPHNSCVYWVTLCFILPFLPFLFFACFFIVVVSWLMCFCIISSSHVASNTSVVFHMWISAEGIFETFKWSIGKDTKSIWIELYTWHDNKTEHSQSTHRFESTSCVPNVTSGIYAPHQRNHCIPFWETLTAENRMEKFQLKLCSIFK